MRTGVVGFAVAATSTSGMMGTNETKRAVEPNSFTNLLTPTNETTKPPLSCLVN
jgi:hypothetical protein